jgi:hypothetical protein
MYIALVNMLLACAFYPHDEAAGGIARLYNNPSCNEGGRGPECTHLPETICCVSAFGAIDISYKC